MLSDLHINVGWSHERSHERIHTPRELPGYPPYVPVCRVALDGHQPIFPPPFRVLLLLLSWLFRHACNLLGPTHMEYKGEICRHSMGQSLGWQFHLGGVLIPPYRNKGLTEKEIFLP